MLKKVSFSNKCNALLYQMFRNNIMMLVEKSGQNTLLSVTLSPLIRDKNFQKSHLAQTMHPMSSTIMQKIGRILKCRLGKREKNCDVDECNDRMMDRQGTIYRTNLINRWV